MARLRIDQTAKGLGVHPRTVTRWEIGETHPSPAEWARLAAFFANYAPQALKLRSPWPLPPTCRHPGRRQPRSTSA